MATYVPAKINTQFIYYFALVDQADTKKLKSNPTIASGDFKTSLDGGSFGNLGTLPTVTPSSSVSVKATLSTSEMNGANVTVASIDASGAEWCDRFDNIQTSARQIDDLAFPNTSGRGIDVTTTGEVGLDFANINPPSTNSAIGIGIAWAGSVTIASDTTITFGVDPGVSKEAQIIVYLTGGTNAIGKGRYAIYSGSGEVWTVDPSWVSNGETRPSGTLTASILVAPKFPTATVPTVNTVQIGGTTQTTGVDLAAKLSFIPSITAGSAGGLFIAGTNAATSITTALTANVIGNVTGNLSGSVGSVTGAVGSVTGSVGSVTGLTASDVGAIKTKTDFLPSVIAGGAGGLFIAGSNATTTVNITGNITGTITSVTGSVGSVTGAVGSVTGNIGGLSAAAIINVETAVYSHILPAALSGVTFEQYLNAIGSAVSGKASGLGTATAIYRNWADSANVITATVDASGNRSAVTISV